MDYLAEASLITKFHLIRIESPSNNYLIVLYVSIF